MLSLCKITVVTVISMAILSKFTHSAQLSAQFLTIAERYGYPRLQAAKTEDQAGYNTTRDNERSLNATCNATRLEAWELCKTCMLGACKDRALSDECKSQGNAVSPSFFDGLGMLFEQEVGGFFEDTGDWFSGDFADFWADDFAGGVDDAANEIADFFKGDFADFWADDFAGGLDAAANEVADFFKDDFADFWADDVGGGIGGAANDVADWFKDDFANGLENAANDVADWFKDDFAGGLEDAGNFIGDLFGGKKRKRRSATTASLPACELIKNQTTFAQACSFYKDPSYCPDCDLTLDTHCPAYKAAVLDFLAARTHYSRWNTTTPAGGYKVVSVSYERRNVVESSTGDLVGYTDASVVTELFGETHTFTIPDALNFESRTKEGWLIIGTAIATKSLELAATGAAK